MYSIEFIDNTQKMDFENLDYLIQNYDAFNDRMEIREIPYFAIPFTQQASSSVWLQVLNFDTLTNTYSFVDYLQLDGAKNQTTYFEGYTTSSDNLGLCRIVFKNGSSDIYKVSKNLLKYTTETMATAEIVYDGWITIDISLYEAVDSSHIKIKNSDFSIHKGCGLKINGTISNFIYDVSYSSPDSTIELKGVTLPGTITSISYKKEPIILTGRYWQGSMNKAGESDIFGLDINANETILKETTCTIVYIANNCEGLGSGGGSATWNIQNSSNVIVSNVTLLAGYSDCGMLIDNGLNVLSFHDKPTLEVITGTGNDNVERGQVEIIAFR